MKRDRDDDEGIFGASKAPASFFQPSPNMAIQYAVQNNQRNINDFPDFIQHFLRMNTFSNIPQIIPEVMGSDDLTSVIDSRKLVYPVQYGWDYRGRSFVCLKLNGDFNENGVLIIYRNSQNCWKYCTCGPNCIISPFDYDEKNSRLGNYLTNPQVSCSEKIGVLGPLFQSYREHLPAPDF